MKLEDALKSQGYTDADLAALQPMLADAKFRGALESQFAAVETERDKFREESTGWSKWYQDTAAPTVEKALKAEQDAKAEAAAHAARLKALQDQGLIKLAGEDADPAKVAAASATGSASLDDLRKLGVVTQDDVMKFAEAEGEAIALAHDISAEYSELYGGKSLLTYVGPDGQTRGLRALRREAQAAKRPLYDYVADKFKFGEKRSEVLAAETKKREDAIRADQRSKDIAELANPAARPPSASGFPFVPRPNGDAKQPWDQPGDRSNDRVNRVLQKVLA